MIRLSVGFARCHQNPDIRMTGCLAVKRNSVLLISKRTSRHVKSCEAVWYVLAPQACRRLL